MDNIIEPNESFDFSKLSLAHPSGIQGGAYFTKIEHNKKPLYIQTSKSQTKQGFIKTGKKYYCDLMFDKNSESLINWFEKLENTCQKLIFDRRDTWFENNLEENDIENAFNSTIRIYKSGRYYLLRTNVKNNHNNIPAIKIYNEQEHSMTMDEVNSETNIISILEIQGIKFTSRNFQIEIELKQVMVLNNDPIFDNCLIKSDKKNNTQILDKNLEKTDSIEGTTLEINNNIDDVTIKHDLTDKNLEDQTISGNILEELEPFDIVIDTENTTAENTTTENTTVENTTVENTTTENNDIHLDNAEIIDIETKLDNFNENDNNISLELEFDNLEEDIEENMDNLKEVNKFELSLENNLETIQLKKPNQVYFELYKEARNKAKQAKKNAILAYLEAKNIKKTYMLENLNDSDSDFDAEIDEVSESELDDL